MRRIAWLAAALSATPGALAVAQTLPNRSTDYLFVTNTADVRALWVNPAGLGIVPEASVLAEFSLERGNGDLRVEQYSLGFNSRGISLGYQRNRTPGAPAVGVLRAGAAIPMRSASVGVAFARYSQDSTSSRAVDLGFVYLLGGPFQLGGAVRHIGRPTVEGVALPITPTIGVQWSRTNFQVSGEVMASERLGAGRSGYDVGYRAGTRIVLSRRLPLEGLGILNLGSTGRIRRFHVGLTVGRGRQVTALASAVSRDNSPVFERFSATFLATNPLTGR